MKLSTLQIKYETEKSTALMQYAERKEISVDEELGDALNKLYEKLVPAAVREFIDFNAQNINKATKEKKKSVAVSASQSDTAQSKIAENKNSNN